MNLKQQFEKLLEVNKELKTDFDFNESFGAIEFFGNVESYLKDLIEDNDNCYDFDEDEIEQLKTLLGEF